MFYCCILLPLLTPLLSTCAPKEMDDAHPLQHQEVFFPHNQFSANLIHLIFHILTRLSDIILLNKGGSSTARINPLQLLKEIILLSGSFNLSFFPSFSCCLMSIFIQWSYLRNKTSKEHCYSWKPSKRLGWEMGGRQHLPQKSVLCWQPKVSSQQWETGVSFPSARDQLCSGPHEWTEILINAVQK